MDEPKTAYDGYRAMIEHLLGEVEQRPNGGARGALAHWIKRARETSKPLRELRTDAGDPVLADRRDLLELGQRILDQLGLADNNSEVNAHQVAELEAKIHERLGDEIAREERKRWRRYLHALRGLATRQSRDA